MNKKIIFVGLMIFSVICVITVGVVFALKNSKAKLEYQIEVVKEINYMLFSENNKFGVINKNGEIVVQSKYDEIEIPNPSKPLFICKYGYNQEKGQYQIKVLNDKSEQILYQYVIVEAIKLDSGISEIPYEKSVLKYMDKGKYGLIDFQGNIIVKAKYDEINSFEYNEGLLLVKKDGKYGIININGAIFVKEKYDKIISDGYYQDEQQYRDSGFIVGIGSDNNYKYGYIDRQGKQILKEKFEQLGRLEISGNDIYIVAFENGKAGLYKNKDIVLKEEFEDIGYDKYNNCLVLQKDSKQGISDLNGNIKIDIKYDNIYISGKYLNAQKENQIDIYDYRTNQIINLENIVGLNQTINDNYSIAITSDEKFKIWDISKNELKENQYEYLEYIYDDYFITFKNGKFGVIDADGNKIIDFKYDSIQKISDTKLLQAIDYDKNIITIIYDGRILTNMKNAVTIVKDNYLILHSDNDMKYIDFEGNITESNKVFDRKIYAKKEKDKWGFVDKNGNQIIEPKYEFVTELNNYGFAGIKSAGKWGVINSNGEIIIEPTYSIETNSPNFVGKYYEYNLDYGESYFICK